MVLKAFKYRLNPTLEQSILIDKHIGSCRFLYNLALETKQTAYIGKQVNLSCFDLINQLPELKKECTWLKEINAQSLQSSISNLDSAYTNFFNGKSAFPVYKSKNNKSQSFTVPQSIKLSDKKLIIPKFKKGIDIVKHRDFDGKVKRVIISRTCTGKYFASIIVETNDIIKNKKKITKENTIGVDLGLKDFLTTSKGFKVKNPNFLKKSISKLKYTQKRYSKNKGKKSLNKLRKIHEKITNQRGDFLHKVSSDLVKNHDTIALETLKVKNMMKNHNLAQSISNASWGKFVSMLEYKADWYGVNIIKIGTFETSSKTCSTCGCVNKELKLSDRKWTCKKCNAPHDRDINAAVNIKHFALKKLCTEYTHKNREELPTMVGVLTHEATL